MWISHDRKPMRYTSVYLSFFHQGLETLDYKLNNLIHKNCLMIVSFRNFFSYKQLLHHLVFHSQSLLSHYFVNILYIVRKYSK
jgi:hypothetical protein